MLLYFSEDVFAKIRSESVLGVINVSSIIPKEIQFKFYLTERIWFGMFLECDKILPLS